MRLDTRLLRSLATFSPRLRASGYPVALGYSVVPILAHLFVKRKC